MGGGKNIYNVEYGILSFIGILCVVMGHVGCDLLSINGWMPYASFHVPLFFFISGCFYKRRVEKTPVHPSIVYLIKKLLIPFYIVYLVYWILYLILNKWFGCTIGIEGMNFKDYIMSPFLATQPIGFCAPAWFVITLFGVRVTHLVIQKWMSCFKMSESNKCLWTMIIYIIIGNIAFQIGDSVIWEWGKNILKIIVGLSFYQIGYIFHNFLDERVNEIKFFWYFGFLFIFREILWVRRGWASIAMYSFSDIEEGYFVIIFSAMIGILFWYRIAHCLATMIDKDGLIIYVSRHTFSIMINHLFAVFLIQGIVLMIQKVMKNFQFNIDAYKSQEYFVFSKNPVVPILLAISAISIIASVQKIAEKLFEKVKFYGQNKY